MIYEIAIQAFDYPEPHRAKAGDIVCVRRPTHAIGTLEQASLLWITVDIPDPRIIDGITQPRVDGSGRVVEKRRFRIPLAKLKALMSSLDLDRVANPKDRYQPFVGVRAVGGDIVMDHKTPVPITGIFEDKVAQR